MSTFLKQYSVIIETRATKTDLLNLKQAPFEPLRAYINKFRKIKVKISHLNEGVALAALKMASGSHPSSEKKWRFEYPPHWMMLYTELPISQPTRKKSPL